jgi:hypothetical protein
VSANLIMLERKASHTVSATSLVRVLLLVSSLLELRSSPPLPSQLLPKDQVQFLKGTCT